MALKKLIILITPVVFCNILFLESVITVDLTDDLSTIEPEASTGCPAPDFRFSRPRVIEITTDLPYADLRTTQTYIPENLATSDSDIIDKIDGDSTVGRLTQDDIVINPYQFELDPTEKEEILETDTNIHNQDQTHKRNKSRRNKKRRFTGGRRWRLENENGQSGGRSGRGRYRRHVIYKSNDETQMNSNNDINSTKLFQSNVIYYIEITDFKSPGNLTKSKSKKHKKNKSLKRKTSTDKNKVITKAERIGINKTTEILNGTKVNTSFIEFTSNDETTKNDRETIDEPKGPEIKHDDENILQRVKRKSGKTTGALSRPKGGGDSGSKTTSRKDKGGYDEEGGYSPVHPEEESSEEDTKSSESSEHSHFAEVSEIRFPGEVGPLGDRRLCKIKCVKGKWVGPLCATNEEDDHGNIKFQPLYKSCRVARIPPHLLLSYRNISVNVGWDLPHGHSLQARCKDLGLYKLLGESRVLCSNGLWAPRMPSCVPTTLLTNFSDDSPPSIRIKIGTGSGAFEPSGVLAVLPGSTIHLDCIYPRRRGTPEWTWTGWFKQYYTGWSTIPEEKATKYRLTIKDIQNQDSGTYTCASPRGLTNSISIIVATSQCPNLLEATPPLSLYLEGNKLGQRALYHCPLGYTIEGTANSTCLASGNWSSPPPTCHPVQCPPLLLEDPHLSLTELNTSAWGRAVFKCSWGFRLSGPPGLECEPTGAWSGPVPRCRAIQCPQPLVPINGRIDGTSGSNSHRKYAVGALVTFSCTEGHLLVGEASIVCTETGFWSHPPPFCKSQCSYPGDPPNGLIAPLKFHYDPGDLLSVQCRPGFVEYSASGPPERPRCLPDGNWSGPVPQCRSYEEV